MACLALTTGAVGAPAGAAAAPSDMYTFVSAPNLHPVRAQLLVHRPGLARGLFLTTSPTGIVDGQQYWGGPLILDSHARPVWFVPTNSAAAYVQQQTYEGKPVLVWEYGREAGHVVIYDEHYRRIATITARAPWTTDMHDAWITGGDIWVTAARLVHGQDLTAYGGSANGTVADEGVQEFQISTGKLIQTWDALNPGGRPNVPLSASVVPPSGTWDAYHINAVQGLPNGDVLVSMRNTSAVYLVNPRANRTIWTLGGKYSSFAAGPGAAFIRQHDARLVDPAGGGQGQNVELTLFNNNNNDLAQTANPSEGMVLSLNTIARQATLARAYRHYPPITAYVAGSLQLLPNGNAVVGWGSEPYFSEYSPSGHVLLDVQWPAGGTSYRALFSDSWTGTPYYPPSGAVRGDTVYASWNGATQVAEWEVLAGSSAKDLKVVAKHPRGGFETAIRLSRTFGTYEVRALTGAGRTLGTSKPFS